MRELFPSKDKRPEARARSVELDAPSWGAPLDVARCIAAIPARLTTKGFLLLPMIVEARRRGIVLEGARERYLPFFDYPLVEHARLLVESAHAFFPHLPIRQGLRKLGRAAHAALVETTLGKVVWAGADRVDGAIDSVAKCYAITMPSARVRIVERAPGRARVRLEDVHTFLDSHHVGVFEGAMRACRARGTVLVRLESPMDGELLLSWRLPE